MDQNDYIDFNMIHLQLILLIFIKHFMSHFAWEIE